MESENPCEETRQPTKAELDARIDMCRQLLAVGKHDGEIKRAVAAKFALSTRTVERYLRRARDALIAATELPAVEHKSRSLAFYERVRGDQHELTRNRLQAQERIDKLLGLEAPTKIRVSDGDIDEQIERALAELASRSQTQATRTAASEANVGTSDIPVVVNEDKLRDLAKNDKT